MDHPAPSPPLLPERFHQIFYSRREETALVENGVRISYGDLWDGVRKVRSWLQDLGVRPGDRIAAHMPSCRESALVYLASLFHGTVLLPLNPRYTEDEVRYFLQDAGASLFVRILGEHGSDKGAVWEVFQAPRDKGTEPGSLEKTGSWKRLWDLISGYPPSTSPPHEPAPDQTALLCYTSGTTGRPKGAEITHGNLAGMAAGLYEAWQWSERDVLLHALPLFHVHGLLVALQGGLYAGAEVRLLPRFSPAEVLRCLEQEPCTIFMGVPTMYHRLLQETGLRRPSLPGMRLFVSGSAPLSGDLFHGFRKVFGHTILERYGMTEAGMVLSNPVEGDRVPESVGFPLPGVTVRIVDPETGKDLGPGEAGELLIRSGSLFKGYWQRPEANREVFLAGGWFRSGDMARQDETGRYFLLGRRKELIITGGFNVYPKEVERVLESHPSVQEAAVFGLDDPAMGELVAASVVLGSSSPVSEHELIEHCRESLTPYKCPRTVRFLEQLPRNAMGKVVKDKLRKP